MVIPAPIPHIELLFLQEGPGWRLETLLHTGLIENYQSHHSENAAKDKLKPLGLNVMAKPESDMMLLYCYHWQHYIVLYDMMFLGFPVETDLYVTSRLGICDPLSHRPRRGWEKIWEDAIRSAQTNKEKKCIEGMDFNSRGIIWVLPVSVMPSIY